VDALFCSEYASGRDVFDLLGGIYGTYPSVTALKGLPKDMSEMTECCYQMSAEDHYAVHHEGWLNSDELRQLQQKLNELNPAANPLDHDLEESYFHCYIRGNAVSSHCGFEDSRLIFWFC